MDMYSNHCQSLTQRDRNNGEDTHQREQEEFSVPALYLEVEDIEQLEDLQHNVGPLDLVENAQERADHLHSGDTNLDLKASQQAHRHQ